MTQWWALIAVFWVALLVDCVKIFPARWWRVFVTAAWGRAPRRPPARFRPCAGTQYARVVFAPPLPVTWQAYADNLPFAFSPEGICNITTGAIGNAPVAPQSVQSWPWEEIKSVEKKGGRLWVNGRDFCPVTVYADAAELQALARHCATLAHGECEHYLERILRGWFRPTRLRRAIARVNARTAALAYFASFNTVIALVVSVCFLADVPSMLGHYWAQYFVMRLLPLLALWAAGAHIAALVSYWRAHRRLLPGRAYTEQRINMLLGAAFLPPQVFRLRAQVAAAALPAQHPLAWLATVASAEAFREGAAHVLRDLRWPLASAANADPRLAADIAAWMRVRVMTEAERLLALRGMTAAELLAAPAPDNPESQSYCPRCREQFTKQGGSCACGTPLVVLTKVVKT